jgi:hypothetical protein
VGPEIPEVDKKSPSQDAVNAGSAPAGADKGATRSALSISAIRSTSGSLRGKQSSKMKTRVTPL